MLVLGVVVGSLLPGSEVPAVSVSDKLQHFAAYALLALWFGGLSHREAHGWVALALLLLGALMEVLQGVLPLHRTADLRDLLANALGIQDKQWRAMFRNELAIESALLEGRYLNGVGVHWLFSDGLDNVLRQGERGDVDVRIVVAGLDAGGVH